MTAPDDTGEQFAAVAELGLNGLAVALAGNRLATPVGAAITHAGDGVAGSLSEIAAAITRLAVAVEGLRPAVEAGGLP